MKSKFSFIIEIIRLLKILRLIGNESPEGDKAVSEKVITSCLALDRKE